MTRALKNAPTEDRDNRVLGLLAHCVRNLEPHEAQTGCNVVVNLLSQRTPDEIVAALKEAWAELGRFDKARERFAQVWEAVAKRVPGLATRSLDETIRTARSTPRRTRSYEDEEPRYRPPWQTDERACHSDINETSGFRNVLYCMRAIYDRSVELGDERRRVTFWAHDGSYSRGVFTAFCSDAALGFGGEVMEKWNSEGANPYATKAVFATFDDDKQQVLLVRMLGRDVTSDNVWLAHESFNRNPFNDHAFEEDVRALIADAEATPKRRRNSDERLRGLEREAARGDPQAEARVLVERMRAGELGPENVALAAVLGDEAARQARPDWHATIHQAWRGELPRSSSRLPQLHFSYVARFSPPAIQSQVARRSLLRNLKDTDERELFRTTDERELLRTRLTAIQYRFMRFMAQGDTPAALERLREMAVIGRLPSESDSHAMNRELAAQRDDFVALLLGRLRRNSDEDLRKLEREALLGDPQAEASLRSTRLRVGLPVEPFVPPAHLESVLDQHGGFTAVTGGSRVGRNATHWRPGRVLRHGVAGELTRYEGGRFYQNIEPVVWGYYKVRGYRYPVITFWHELTGERIA